MAELILSNINIACTHSLLYWLPVTTNLIAQQKYIIEKVVRTWKWVCPAEKMWRQWRQIKFKTAHTKME